MSRLALAALAAAALASCSPEPRRTFTLGVLGPLPARVAAQCGRLGVAVEPALPPGASALDAADGAGRMAPAARLRFLVARAVVEGEESVWLRLPSAPAGRDLLDYPEEWQAFARVAAEWRAVRPVLEAGSAARPPFEPPPAVSASAWSYGGRRYALLVNRLPLEAPLDPAALRGWRALFAPRADAAEALPSCAGRPCLPPEGVLWLEGPPEEGP